MPGVRAFTPAQEAEVLAEYESGASCWTIALTRGVSEKTVSTVVRRGGKTRPRLGTPQYQRRRFSDEEEARISAAYAAGTDPTELAAAWGCGLATLRNVIRRTGGTWKRRVRQLTKAHNPRWNGGRTVDLDGYVYVLVEEDDPLACMRGHHGYVLEHRLVMARHLGRPLTRRETIHHINGARSDNRIDNLQLRSGNHGPYQAIGCLDCGSHRIGPVPIASEEECT